ncbi:MAG: rod shape-determining protein MreC [Rickettsiales bacterium]|nr:rod shape-determining protein MreC [Rickettsiales bacterium]
MVKNFTTSSLSGAHIEQINRVSVTFFLVLSLFLIIVSKVNPYVVKSVRIYIVDQVAPVVNVLITPIDYMVSILDNVDDLANIREQNILLREENERLRQGYIKTMQIEIENIHLRKLLSFAGEKETDLISSRIIGNTSGAFLRSALINVGSDHKIKKGQAVVNDRGVVGRIIEVGKRSSRILLLTDINSKVPVITNETRERAILTGNNTGDINLLYLPEDTEVKVGEMILTSGDGSLFPPGQPVGFVYKIEDSKVYVKPYVEWSHLEFVSVVDY